MTKTVHVCETFVSIQGETTWAGWPCFFIRLSGCNLRCRYCDTKYAYRGGHTHPIDSLADEFSASKMPLVEVTGGEPLLQPDVYDLLKLLVKRGATLLETNGSLAISKIADNVITILDVKCPGSGQADKNYWRNMRYLRPRDEVKFVLCGRTDYEWARKVTDKYRLAKHCRAVNFSPAVGFLKPQTLASWIIKDCLPVRLNIQLHKQIWPKAARRR